MKHYKYIVCALGFAAALLTGAAQAQSTSVTIGDGTSSSYYAPFCNPFRNALVEMVYPSSLIGTAGWIDTIAFQCATSQPSYVVSNTRLNIYIGHMADSTLADGFVGLETLQLVFSDTNVSNGGLSGWEPFALQHPYYYDGTDNLVVVVERTSTNFSWNIFYRHTAVAGSCRYAYSDSDPSWASVAMPPAGSWLSDSRPNLRIALDTVAAAPCAAPLDVALTDLGDEYLYATIVPNAGDSLWQYSYGTLDSTLGTDTTAATAIGLYDLAPGRLHYLTVRTLCGEDSISPSFTRWFRTQCAPYEAADTFFTAFEMAEGYQTGRGNLHSCWTVGSLQDSTQMPYVGTLIGSDARFLDIEGSYIVTERWPERPLVEARDSAFAILPDLLYDGGITNYRLNFTLQKAQAYYADTLQVGVITDPTDFSTFHLVGEYAATTTATHHEALLSGYAGPEGRLAFLGRCTPGTDDQIFEFFIDSVMVSPIPPCLMPTNLAVLAADTAEVTLGWTAAGSEDQWQVRYRTAGASSWTTVMAFNNPWIVAGLSDATEYEFSVRAYCDTLRQSQWTNAVTGSTRCRLIGSYPWTENFDNGAGNGAWNAACWNNAGDQFYVSGTWIGTNHTPHLYAYWHQAVLTLPRFRFHADSLYLLRLGMLRRQASSSYADAGLYVIANGSDTLAFIHEAINQVPYESAGGWYYYDLPIPRIGDSATITLSTQHGDGIRIDDLSVRVAPSCIMPNAPVVDSVTGSSAHIAWSALGSEGLWQLRYRTDDDTAWSLVDSLAATSHTVTSLQSSSRYELQVRAICGDTVQSEWSWPVEFSTYCAPITEFAWSEDFQSAGTSAWLPSCWERRLSHDVSNLIFKTGSYDAAHTRVLYILTNDTSVDTSAVSSITLPPFEVPVGDYRFSLDMYRYASLYRHGSDSYGGLYVIANSDTLAYIPCLSSQAGINVGTTTEGWQTYTFALPHPGFTRITLTAVTRHSDFFIDNLLLQRQTSCATPGALAVSNVTTTGATLSWTGSGSSWTVRYREADSGSFLFQTVTSTTATLSGLMPGRQYVAYARKQCTDGDSSNWAGPVTFGTPLFDQSILIADGTYTTSMPTMGNNAGTVLRTQTVYPSSMLASIVGDTIAALQYYVSSGSNLNKWDNAVFTVKLATTTASVLTGFSTAPATTVYTGTLTANPEEGMSVVFDNPFVYPGGNLLIEFSKPVASTAQNVSFYGAYRYQSGAYGYGTWINSPSRSDCMPKCRIYYYHTYYTAIAQSNDIAMGTVVGGGSHLELGDTITFTATPNVGYEFSHWSNGDTNSTISFAITGDTLLTAYFQPIAVTVTAWAADSTMGTITGGGQYHYGDTVTLVAHAFYGYELEQWSTGDTGSTLRFVVTSDTLLTAYFQPIIVAVTALSADSTMGTITGGGQYHYGDTVTLVAHPFYGYMFEQWDNGVADSQIAFVATADTAFTAYFQPLMVVVTLFNDTPEWGTLDPVPGSYEVQVGETFSAAAMPNEGCFFGHWSDSRLDTLVTTPNYTLLVEAADRERGIELHASFLPPQEGIGDVLQSQVVISVQGSDIIVSGAQRQPVWIFDCYGRLLVHRIIAERAEGIPVPASGLYFVKVGSQPAKCVVAVRR